jgi:hypothetical protein
MPVQPDVIAARLFPGSDPLNRQCRRAISEIGLARRWFELGIFELANLEDMVWHDLLEIRNQNEDFDRFSARSAEFSAENSQRFLARTNRHLADALESIQLARLEGELSLLAKVGDRGSAK